MKQVPPFFIWHTHLPNFFHCLDAIVFFSSLPTISLFFMQINAFKSLYIKLRDPVNHTDRLSLIVRIFTRILPYRTRVILIVYHSCQNEYQFFFTMLEVFNKKCLKVKVITDSTQCRREWEHA